MCAVRTTGRRINHVISDFRILERVIAVSHAGKRVDRPMSTCRLPAADSTVLAAAATTPATTPARHWRKPSRVSTPPAPGFTIVHADEQLLVVDKASGLLTVPGVLQSDSLFGRLVATGWPTAQIVHRLDRDTSGLLVVALDPVTHSHLSAQFQNREVKKTYTAVVAGHVKDDNGEIDLPIRKDMVNTPLQLVDHDRGKPSRTLWRVVERRRTSTRLQLTPLSGRTHQLRLHLSEIGHPICGDDLYATPQALEMAPRLCLHAEQLDFMHPGRSCEWISFTATTEAF